MAPIDRGKLFLPPAWGLSAALAALAVGGCAGFASESETGLASMAHVLAAQAEARFDHPAGGSPTKLEGGGPGRFEPGDVAPPLDGLDRDPDCPAEARPRVRATAGDSCAGYQAEIGVWTDWCAERCDENGTDLVAARAAIAACSDWCSEHGCATATFVPPADGCAAYDCYEDGAECAAESCGFREYCSLLDIRRVWNCFCRDLGLP